MVQQIEIILKLKRRGFHLVTSVKNDEKRHGDIVSGLIG